MTCFYMLRIKYEDMYTMIPTNVNCILFYDSVILDVLTQQGRMSSYAILFLNSISISINYYSWSAMLKMLGLYLYTLLIGHKSCNILSILNKWKLSKELQTFVTNNVFLTKSKNTTTTKQKIKHKNPSHSQKLNAGPLAHKAAVFPLNLQVDCSQCVGHTVSLNFSVIFFTSMNNCIWQISYIYGSMFHCFNMVNM